MDIEVFGYTGCESECEVVFKKYNKIVKSFFVENLTTTLSMDPMGYGKVRIDTIKCLDYDTYGNPIPISLTDKEFVALERELIEYIDWSEWLDNQRPDDDDYEERSREFD